MGSSPISGTSETPQVMQIVWEAPPLRYKSHFGHQGESMITHEMNLQSKYFDFMKNGTKRIELRLNDEKRQQLQLGDVIEFSDGSSSLRAEIIGLLRYRTFEDLFEDFDASILADSSMTKPEILKALEEFYTPEKQAKYGVLGIRIKILN